MSAAASVLQGEVITSFGLVNITSLTKTGTGTWTLSGASTFTGPTTISGGKLALSGIGSIATTPKISIAASATFDVSAITPTSYAITGSSPVQTLAGSSTSGTATINATGKPLTLNSGALLSFQGTGTTVGKISVTGDLTLNANAITVNVSSTALAAGTYRLMDCTGTLTGSANATPTITGTPLRANYTATVSTTTGSGGHVDLVVKALPVFSGLTLSQSISYGTATVTLSGVVSATTGPVYPADGETVSVTINGNTQFATIAGGVGGFTISFPTATIPYSATAYTITYAYAGNATTLQPAASNTANTLTVTKAPLTITAPTVTKVYDGTTTAGAVTVGTLSGFVGSETVTATGTATAYSSANVSSAYASTVSYTLAAGTGGGLAANYSLANSVIANAAITARPITVTAAANSKPYDGTTIAAATPTGNALQNGDVITSGETYDNANVGTTHVLTPDTVVIKNAAQTVDETANYAITPATIATGIITAATPTISGVTASQSINFGTASVTLGGVVSAAGPVYPADGETVGVTINGVTQNAPIAGGAGAFSVSYTTATIPASATPYTITYSYAGNANLNPAADNTSTTLSVYNLTTTPLSLTTSSNTAATVSYQKLATHVHSTLQSAVYPASPWTASVTTPATHGTAAFSGSGSLTYTPTNYTGGADSFTVTFGDGYGSQTMLVSVTVTTNGVGGQSANAVYTGTLGTGVAVVHFAGIPGTSYTVETNGVASSGSGWVKEGTYPAPTDNSAGYGIGVFGVTNAFTGNLFYRTVTPAY